MSTHSLEIAYNLLDLLEYSLGVGTSPRETALPIGGIREVLGQIKQIVGANCDSDRQINRQSTANSNGHSVRQENGTRREIDTKDPISTISFDQKSHDLDEGTEDSDGVALERIAFMNIPKVRTVSPEIRGKIRELVGIEAEEVF